MLYLSLCRKGCRWRECWVGSSVELGLEALPRKPVEWSKWIGWNVHDVPRTEWQSNGGWSNIDSEGENVL